MDQKTFRDTASETHDFFLKAREWIEAFFSPKHVHFVEPKAASPDSLYRVMDWGAGIDYIFEDSGSTRVYGLSTRFQVANPPPGTFTIRHGRESGTPTEYEKWVNVLDDPRSIRPAYHIQGYFNEDRAELLELGIAPIEALVGMIRQSRCTERQIRDGRGLNKFYIVSMDEMVKLRLPISLVRLRGEEILDSHTSHRETYDEAVFGGE